VREPHLHERQRRAFALLLAEIVHQHEIGTGVVEGNKQYAPAVAADGERRGFWVEPSIDGANLANGSLLERVETELAEDGRPRGGIWIFEVDTGIGDRPLVTVDAIQDMRL
jgi:hypothetical protein